MLPLLALVGVGAGVGVGMGAGVGVGAGTRAHELKTSTKLRMTVTTNQQCFIGIPCLAVIERGHQLLVLFTLQDPPDFVNS